MLRDMEAVESGSKEPEEVISKLLEELIDVIGKAETELSIHSP